MKIVVAAYGSRGDVEPASPSARSCCAAVTTYAWL